MAETQTLPLTPGQERIWLTEQRHPGTSVNHLVGCYWMDGPVAADVLADALREVTSHHEALRTGFVEQSAQPVTVLHNRIDPLFELIDVGTVQEALCHAREAARRPFDIARPGLVRLVLCRLGPRDHLLTLVVHHLVADGSAASILVRDLTDAYHARAAGLAWAARSSPVSYRTFVAQELARRGSNEERSDLDHWSRVLAGAPAAVDLPTDFRRPARRSDGTYSAGRTLTEESLTSLRRFARQHRSSPTLVMAAAWAATLSRLSGQDDVVTGITVSRRDHPTRAELVATLVNVLPLRVRVPADATLGSLVVDIRRQVLAVLTHQGVPLQRIVDDLNPERVPGRPPLVHLLFNQDAAGAGPAIDGVRVIPVDLDVPAGMDLDLELSVVSSADHRSLHTVIRGATDLFQPEAVRHLLGQFMTLLEDGVARGSATVAKLQLMSASGRASVQELCTGPTAAADLAMAPGRLAQRMRAQAQAPALWADGVTVTYGQLHHKVTAVAANLADAGVRRGDVVAVYAYRSADLLAGMLAAWWLGAAYLPIDPGYPPPRVEYLLDDSAAVAIVTTRAQRSTLPASQKRVVEIDSGVPTGLVPTGPEPVSSDDLAYVIYTSGSTGAPKGVRVTHGGLANLLDAVVRETGIDGGTVMLGLTSPSFDIAAVELFAPLWAGGRIVLAAPGEELDPPGLAALIAQHGVTFVQATPATWKQLVEVLPGRTRLRQAICAGEPLGRGLAQAICRCADAVWNGYGPTEATIYAAWHRVDPEGGGPQVPIGRPVAGTVAYVVDRHLQRQPRGVPGELLLGGVGLADGYHRRPGLTAERFIGNPFGDGRVYRTGDLVRLRPDGELEFQRRQDNQVKVRGYRIELDEIVEVLRTHPAVSDAVVTVQNDAHEEPRLVAYVVRDGRSQHHWDGEGDE